MRKYNYILGCALISFFIGMFMFAGIIGFNDPLVSFIGHIHFVGAFGYLIFHFFVFKFKGKKKLLAFIISAVCTFIFYSLLYTYDAIPFIDQDSIIGQILYTVGMGATIIGMIFGGAGGAGCAGGGSNGGSDGTGGSESGSNGSAGASF